MILSPTPFVGWNPVFKGAARYLAFAKTANFDATADVLSGARVSNDGEHFVPAQLKGDIASYRNFIAEFMFVKGNYVFVGGAGSMAATGNPRALLFRSTKIDPLNFAIVATGIEQELSSAAYRLVAMADSGAHLVVAANDGSISSSADGGASFQDAGRIPFNTAGSTTPLTGLIASPSGFVAFGNVGLVSGNEVSQLYTAATPSGPWTYRDPQFGGPTATVIRAGVAGNVFVVVGSGRISTAPLNNLSTWTARTSPAGFNLANLAYFTGSRYFLGSSQEGWVASTDSINWSIPADNPIEGREASMVSISQAGSKLFAHLQSGLMAKSDDGQAWDVIANPGLALSFDYRATAFIGI